MNRLQDITVPVQRTFNLPTLAMVEMVAGDRGWGPINLGLEWADYTVMASWGGTE